MASSSGARWRTAENPFNILYMKYSTFVYFSMHLRPRWIGSKSAIPKTSLLDPGKYLDIAQQR